MENKKERIIEFGKKVWSLLTEEEQVHYYNVDGTYQFVEYIVDILGLNEFDWTNIELVETIHDEIFRGNTMKKEVYGIYAPDHDITFVMEEYFTDDGEPASLEVKGFYYGEPNEYDNRTYYGDLKAKL